VYELVCVACLVRGLTYTGDTGDGFAAGQIGDVDEGVVEGSENAGNAEDELALSNCQFVLERLVVKCRCHEPRGPGVQAGCSPAHRARPSSWEACWLCMGS
jgi:hypothetical protein